jgi:methionyl aminopeptidase
MSIDTPQQLEGLRAAGRVVAAALREMRRHVRPGVSTRELDRVAARVFARYGARSGPQLDYDFPGVTCISVGDEVVHGIPGPRKLRAGELVKLDVTAELNGYYADACVTVPVGRAEPRSGRLIAASQRALRRGIAAAEPGAPVSAIGRAVQAETEQSGFTVLAELTGHGIGRRIHEPPTVHNVYRDDARDVLTDGLVITIEPMITAGRDRIHMAEDGWTVRTDDGAPAAHAEHTLVVREGGALVLTA